MFTSPNIGFLMAPYMAPRDRMTVKQFIIVSKFIKWRQKWGGRVTAIQNINVRQHETCTSLETGHTGRWMKEGRMEFRYPNIRSTYGLYLRSRTPVGGGYCMFESHRRKIGGTTGTSRTRIEQATQRMKSDSNLRKDFTSAILWSFWLNITKFLIIRLPKGSKVFFFCLFCC